MEIANEAQKILSMMGTFSWPIFAGFILLTVWSGLIRGGYTSRENLTATAGIVGVISIFVGFTFLNIEGGDIVDVMKAYPAWGIYVVLLGLATLAAIANEAIRHFRQNREVYSLNIDGADGDDDIGESKRKPHVKAFILGSVLWSIATIGAIYWLWKIGTGVPTP